LARNKIRFNLQISVPDSIYTFCTFGEESYAQAPNGVDAISTICIPFYKQSPQHGIPFYTQSPQYAFLFTCNLDNMHSFLHLMQTTHKIYPDSCRTSHHHTVPHQITVIATGNYNMQLLHIFCVVMTNTKRGKGI
jgi:hypothetical protein